MVIMTPTAPLERRRLSGGWQAKPYQRVVFNALEGGVRRVDVVAHRRWGKDEVALYWAAGQAARTPGVYWHLLPEARQGRKAIWNAVNPHSGKRRIDEAFPQWVRARTVDAEMIIHLKNGSTWQVAGSDNYNSLVGSPPIGVVFSEWALAKPEAWDFIRPILAENGGWALFLWTPRGRGHATRSFEARMRAPGWTCIKSAATETNVFTKEQLEQERAELVAELGSPEEGEARFASEYLVDFDAAAPGAYYAGLIGDAERAGRITSVPHDPSLKVDTAWDLGVDDYTAIWFFQRVGREIRVIDYFETRGEGLAAIMRRALGTRDWVWGRHHLPHDVAAREISTATSRLETLRGLGLSQIETGAAVDPEERVNATRLMIPLCWFDAQRCAGGLDRLRAYRKRWNRTTRSYGGPLHDEASHAADAFGEFALTRTGGWTSAAPLRRDRERGHWMG
jgi:phage terminase large subunit